MEGALSYLNLRNQVHGFNSHLIYERINKALDTVSLSFQMSHYQEEAKYRVPTSIVNLDLDPNLNFSEFLCF